MVVLFSFTPSRQGDSPEGHTVSLRSTGVVAARCRRHLADASDAALMRLVNYFAIFADCNK